MEPGADNVRRVLLESQRLGFLGAQPIDAVVEHAGSFVRALQDVHGSVLDLGSGGGVPGLVIAGERPDLAVTLLDRRQKRTDFLERMVRRLGWQGRVEVVEADASSPSAISGPYAAVVARGFGPPERTLETAARFVAVGGLVVVSEPPSPDDRWDAGLLERTGMVRRTSPDARVAVFERR